MTRRNALLGTLVLVAPLMIGSRAEATTIYTFAGLNTTASTTTPNATASALGFSSLAVCTSSAGNPQPSCGGFGSSTASFSVAPLPGYVLNVTGFSFDENNTGTLGPTAFGVFTSADGFASPILSGALAPSAPTFTTHATALAFVNLSTALEVRIVSTGGPAPTAGQTAWLLDNVTLIAEAVPARVPEPASGLLLFAGAAAALRRRRITAAPR
jgi:hypothetical protein